MIHGALKLAANNDHVLLHEVLKQFKHWLAVISKDLMEADNFLRRFFIIADLMLTTIMGMIKDKVVTEGFDVINDIDYREWLAKHNAAQVTLDSAIVQGVYGLVFVGGC